ncbi:MAG: hypothetical protein SOY60_07505 [Fusobacterium gastrosuis]|uniref:hypothetical protein n=1 Tax=Fusobacterium gastrosuis TaxID=1755100 RepID=UPI002A8D50FA|nr:hypothetical protein [Fusobacterium gastrosuis]
MTILTPVISVLTILVYFVLSVCMPIFGYLVPSYKIKKVNIFGNRYRLLINIAVALILYILNVKILFVYLVYPFLTEFLFYVTQRYFKIKTYDRIVVMSLISTIVIFFLVYSNRAYLQKTIEEAILLSSKNFNLDIQDIYNSFIYLKENMISSIFSYLFMGNIFLFLALAPNTYEQWKISCYWLLPFMTIIIVNRLIGISFNLYLEDNIIMITRYIYTWYGIKALYQLCGKIGVKFNVLKHSISIAMGIFYPLPVFIIGALASFDIVEVENIKI